MVYQEEEMWYSLLRHWDNAPRTVCPPPLFVAISSQIFIDKIDGACNEDLYPACCNVYHDMCMYDGGIESFGAHVEKELQFRGKERILLQRGYSRKKQFEMMSKLQMRIADYRMDRVASYLRPKLLDYLEKCFERYEGKFVFVVYEYYVLISSLFYTQK